MQAVGLQVHVMNRLVFGGIGLVADFNAPQILDPADALHPRHHQAQRVAVFRPQHFAVLAESDQHLAGPNQAHRNGARHRRTISALGQHELARLKIGTSHFQQRDQRYASKFTARNHSVRVLHGGHRHVAPFGCGVGAALHEMKARHRR